MKIYSWNVYYHNKKIELMLNFIKNLDFDVLCLQEVPENLLGNLRALPYQTVHAIDLEFISKEKSCAVYHVILSRFPIRTSGAVPPVRVVLPWRTYTILKFRSGWTDIINREFLYADVETPTGVLRIFSVHLALSRPRDRKNEFELIRQNIPKEFPAIIAGDFNILEFAPIKIFNWLFGSPITHALPWYDERSEFEICFEKFCFQNPLRGQKTHNLSRSQLDHILVPNDAKVLKAEIIKETYGSDHHPVFIEVVI